MFWTYIHAVPDKLVVHELGFLAFALSNFKVIYTPCLISKHFKIAQSVETFSSRSYNRTSFKKNENKADLKSDCPSVRKSNSGLGESFTSNWKLNRQKGCFSELADSFVVTVYFSLQICSFGSRFPKTSSNGIIQLLLYRKITLVIQNSQTN